MTGQEYIDYLNSVLPETTPIGAYCLAFSTAFLKNGGNPTREFCEALRACKTVREGLTIYEEECKRLKKAPKRRRPSKRRSA